MDTVHGAIFKQFKDYVGAELDVGSWDDLRAAAGVDRTIYMSTRSYPDEEFLGLLEVATDRADRSEQELLAAFGEFLAPALLDMYRAQIDDDWDAIDVIAHTEDAIHEVVRLREPEADPPELAASRVDETTVRVHYTSERRLCGLAEGIARGVGDRFDQQVSVTQEQCMLEGADACDIVVTAE